MDSLSKPTCCFPAGQYWSVRNDRRRTASNFSFFFFFFPCPVNSQQSIVYQSLSYKWRVNSCLICLTKSDGFIPHEFVQLFSGTLHSLQQIWTSFGSSFLIILAYSKTYLIFLTIVPEVLSRKKKSHYNHEHTLDVSSWSHAELKLWSVIKEQSAF